MIIRVALLTVTKYLAVSKLSITTKFNAQSDFTKFQSETTNFNAFKNKSKLQNTFKKKQKTNKV